MLGINRYSFHGQPQCNNTTRLNVDVHYVIINTMLYISIWVAVACGILYLWLKKKLSYFDDTGVNCIPQTIAIKTTIKTLTKQEHMIASFDLSYNYYPKDRFVANFEFVTPVITIRDPDLIKQVGVKDFDNFQNHRSFQNQEDFIFSKSLFALKDQKWRDMRSTLSPAFTGSKLRNMVPLIAECGKDILDDLHNKINDEPNKYLDLECYDLMSRYTNDVIATCAFGLKTNSVKDRENQFYMMGRKLTNFKYKQMLQFMVMMLLPFITKIYKMHLMPLDAVNFLTGIVKKTMQQREEKKIFRPDVIQLLLEAREGTLSHENINDEKDAGFATVEESAIGKSSIKTGWDDDHLVAQAFLFFFAGFETVSTSLIFLLHELALNPDIQDKLRTEIDEHYEKHQGKLIYDTIIHMKYMDMVVSEGLRKWPPAVGTDRICAKSYNLGKPNEEAKKDFIVEENTVIVIPVYSIHRDPQYYPNPDKFDPERFSDENKHNINPFTYMPFGIGPRNCIGSRFALVEVKAMVYELLRRFELGPAPNTSVTGKLAPGIFQIRLEGGHNLRFKCRK